MHLEPDINMFSPHFTIVPRNKLVHVKCQKVHKRYFEVLFYTKNPIIALFTGAEKST